MPVCGAAWAEVEADPVPVPVQKTPTENLLATLIRDEASAYENGEGVPRDGARAAELYCKAARMGDAQSQYNLGWMYSNGRGVERSDATAAFFFHAAAEQGWPQAIRMLRTVGGPSSELPECMRPPAAVPVAAAGRVVPPVDLVVPANAPAHIVEIAKNTAVEMKVQPQLVLAIIEAESNFNTAALSPKNAKGLMQLIPETAARFNVSRPYDPAQNIRGGVSYLRWLLAYFEGDVALVAAAYNAGEGAVNRYRGVPPYAETLAYVAKVLRRVGATSIPFDGAATEVSPQMRQIRAARR
ncbi:lytic transglycosylase [Piscinibacter gummiphilus]|uniref:Lytic transglycosylase n=2 Tax=Piscinibacter gummiphilus TaxID=946333 RepID=A0A1W6LIF7_9BURK|nr:lytic transglycosylase [Piscinibacter gummiphilus]ATU68735.1 lytic transglycosylase [Piscinibacter gummiphilus]